MFLFWIWFFALPVEICVGVLKFKLTYIYRAIASRSKNIALWSINLIQYTNLYEKLVASFTSPAVTKLVWFKIDAKKTNFFNFVVSWKHIVGLALLYGGDFNMFTTCVMVDFSMYFKVPPFHHIEYDSYVFILRYCSLITLGWSTRHDNASIERSFRFSKLVAFIVFLAYSIQLRMNDAPWIVTLRTIP